MNATGYRRSFIKEDNSATPVHHAQKIKDYPVGSLITAYELKPSCQAAIDHGCNVVVIDLRGTGASFGANSISMWQNAQDVAFVIDWIAEQSWATDKVGMVGGSWEGVTQLATAVFRPKHLTCIVPQVPPNLLNATHDNGLASIGFIKDWAAIRSNQDATEQSPPVDGPDGKQLFDEAQSQRVHIYEMPGVDQNPNIIDRDMILDLVSAVNPDSPMLSGRKVADVFDEAEAISASGTAVYLQSGWWDMTFAGPVLDLFNELTGPKRVLIGPWSHFIASSVEVIRWFDYWLKGIDNGIMDEDPVVYSTSQPDGSINWKQVRAWPPSGTEYRLAYLSPHPSGTIDSAHDGSISFDDVKSAAPISYPVNYDVGMGESGRMRFMFWNTHISHVDLIERAEKCLTFTSPPLTDELVVTGIPALEIDVTKSRESGALFVTLEQVLPDGRVAYLSEGWINFANRKAETPPRKRGGKFYHSMSGSSVLPVVPGQPMTIEMELYALSVKVIAGSRLRLTIAGNDADNFKIERYDPAPKLQVQVPATLHLPFEVEDKPVIQGAFSGEDVGFAFDPLE